MLKNFLYKIFNKIKLLFKKILIFFSSINYKKEEFESKQTEFFKELGLDRAFGLDLLNKKKDEFDFLNRSMSSEHEVVFASISKTISPKKILEIGTHDGNNAFLLSKIFCNSEITTIDLPDDHDDFKNFYGRKDNLERFITNRDRRLKDLNNLKFIKMNSLNLINHKEKYDLIWVDGAHGYPVGCIDLINSIKILNPNGIIICDDIWKNNENKSERLYDSRAYFQTIEVLKNEKIINSKFLYKRLEARFNSSKQYRKYLAFIKKNDN